MGGFREKMFRFSPDIISVRLINPRAQRTDQTSISKALEVATFAAGCFWCTEAVFDQLKGVVKVVSGYSGGNTANPSYEEVCTGDTGHAESIEITFDPSIISFKDL